MENTEVIKTPEATLAQSVTNRIDEMIRRSHRIGEPFVRYQIGMWVEGVAGGDGPTGGLVELTGQEYMALRKKLAELRADWNSEDVR